MRNSIKTRNECPPLGFTVKAIIAEAGGYRAVADKLGLTYQAVHRWGSSIPMEHARKVAVMAGLPLEIVRPDFVRAVTPVASIQEAPDA